MPETGWKKLEKNPRSKRRLVKTTYNDYPLYDWLSVLGLIGFVLMLLGAGAIMPPLEKATAIMLIFLGGGLFLPRVILPRNILYTEEEYMPEEEDAAPR